MPPPPAQPGPGARTSAQVNAAIRAFSAGRTWWSKDALAELARLQGQWIAAVQDEAERAEEAQGGFVRAA